MEPQHTAPGRPRTGTPTTDVEFFVGLHQLADAQHFEQCMISVNRTERRVSDFAVGDWIMDSGAFTALSRDGEHKRTPEGYAALIRRWSTCGNLLAAVCQDFMCEPFIIEKTGQSVEEHQRRTIERYDRLTALDTPDDPLGTYVMPVLQGYEPGEYVRHVRAYGERLAEGAWVGVGSVCKRNVSIPAIEAVLTTIRDERPDLRLHGFGLKTTALGSHVVRLCLHSADSMAWSFAARAAGRNANDWREARSFCNRIERQPLQTSILGAEMTRAA